MLLAPYPSVSKCCAATETIASRVRTARACVVRAVLPVGRPMWGRIVLLMVTGAFCGLVLVVLLHCQDLCCF